MDSMLLQFLRTYQTRLYEKGQVILSPEQEAQQVFFVTSGFIRAYTITREGNEFSAVLLGSGMYFPIFRYLSDSTYKKKSAIKYYYSCLTEAEVTAVTIADLIHFLNSNPKIATQLTDMYYINAKLLQSKLEFMVYTHSAYKKVCYFLLFLSKKFGQKTSQGIVIMPPFTHKEFATFVGLSREAVSYQISRLKKNGIIEDGNSIICIKNIVSLEKEL